MLVKITYLMSVFNEEDRVADILHHAVQWADEVLILDKQSSDRTQEICAQYGSKVRVVEIPYTTQGRDDMVSACQLATHDWIWVGTSSEVPTRKIVNEAKRLVRENPELDLIQVPRKIYSFGCDSPDSPWGVRNYPFLINRKQALITNTIHHNFSPKTPKNFFRIPYANDCCVHHYTHTTARGYISAMMQYLVAESERPDQPALLQDAVRRLEKRPDLQSLSGRDAFGLECAWRIYWNGVALYAWENMRGLDATKSYQEMRAAKLKEEWPSTPEIAPASGSICRSTQHEVTPAVMLQGKSESRKNSENPLLCALLDRPICQMIKTLYLIGAHRFQEKSLLFSLFPNLQRVVLFEPLPDLFARLVEQEKADPRVTVLPYAIAAQNGEASFQVSGDDGAFGSILTFDRHVKPVPEVQTKESIQVCTRTLARVMEEHGLPPPDFILLAASGMAHQILQSLTREMLHQIRMIYSEASTGAVNAGSCSLADLEGVLSEEFSFSGYCPLKEQVPNDGYALFVHRSQTWLLLPPEPPVSLQDIMPVNRVKPKWVQSLTGCLPRKLRRSIWKRLRSVTNALAE